MQSWQGASDKYFAILKSKMATMKLKIVKQSSFIHKCAGNNSFKCIINCTHESPSSQWPTYRVIYFRKKHMIVYKLPGTPLFLLPIATVPSRTSPIPFEENAIFLAWNIAGDLQVHLVVYCFRYSSLQHLIRTVPGVMIIRLPSLRLHGWHLQISSQRAPWIFVVLTSRKVQTIDQIN